MRRIVMPLVGALIAAAVVSGLALGGPLDDGSTNNKTFEYAIGLWGDLPYSNVQSTDGLPNLIADMNSQNLAFTAHDGDLKAGSGSPCNDALYQSALDRFNSLDAPAVFTPGDNDWTDCDRASNGSFNSLERLDHERALSSSVHRSRLDGRRCARRSSRTRPASASSLERRPAPPRTRTFPASRTGAGPSTA
jgi:hypothetical protein